MWVSATHTKSVWCSSLVWHIACSLKSCSAASTQWVLEYRQSVESSYLDENDFKLLKVIKLLGEIKVCSCQQFFRIQAVFDDNHWVELFNEVLMNFLRHLNNWREKRAHYRRRGDTAEATSYYPDNSYQRTTLVLQKIDICNLCEKT